jgi:hypothetical protein
MNSYVKPAIVDHGDLKKLTAASLLGPFYDCNARPGNPVIDDDKGSSQTPSC